MRQALFVFSFFLSFSLSAQNLLDKTISVSFSNNTILQCIKKIESKNKISFSYNTNWLKAETKKVSKTFTEQKLSNVLNDIFNQTKLQYKQIGNQITIFKSQNNQQLVKLSGYIINKQSKEKLIGAKLYFKEIGQGCISNAYGYFQINLPKGQYHYQAISLGMMTKNDSIIIDSDMLVNIELAEKKIVLKTVEVLSKNNDTLTTVVNDINSLDKTDINLTQINQLPTSTALPDVTRNIQQLPGVQPSFDGTSSYKVRGLQSGNNLILLDEIPIYHPNHLLGVYSIINSNAIKSATFYKDYIPAQFGTRNSSVLNVYTKEGNLTTHHLSLGLGANVPVVNMEGPLIINKSSFFVSARKSFSPLSEFRLPSATNLPLPDFYDITFKVNYQVNQQNRLFFTTYLGNDKIVDADYQFKWGNKATSFRWNRVINDKAFTNLTVVLNEFNYKTLTGLKSDSIQQKVRTDLIKYRVTDYVSNNKQINYGVSFLRTKTNNSIQKGLFLNRKAIEIAFFSTLKNTINKKWRYEFGLRIPFNFQIGTNDSAYYLTPDLTYHPVYYKKKNGYNFKFSIDPRLLINYQINTKNKLQFSSNITTQFTHILKYNSSVFPVEIWTTSNQYLKPERNFQTSVGLVHTEKYFKTSASLFARHVTNVIDYVNTNFSNNNYGFESNLLSGKINVIGIELMTQFKKGEKYNGSVSYTYNYAWQQTKGINNNQFYVPQYFRPHFVSFNQYYILSKKWEFGSNFIFHSPTTINLPTGKVTVNNIEYPLYGNTKNTSYLPVYHRLDVTIKRTLGIKKQKNRGLLLFTFVNIYNRQNVSNAFVGVDSSNPNKIEIKQQSYAPGSFYITYKLNL